MLDDLEVVRDSEGDGVDGSEEGEGFTHLLERPNRREEELLLGGGEGSGGRLLDGKKKREGVKGEGERKSDEETGQKRK